jgi:tetratricopeptide (TPR) repeat protein
MQELPQNAHRSGCSRLLRRRLAVLVCTLTVLIGRGVQAQSSGTTPNGACEKLNGDALRAVAQGQSAEAERILAAAFASADRTNPVCAGVTMSNIAALLEGSGRLSQAGGMALRAVHALEDSLPPGDPALLRPLRILGAAQFQQGKLAKAREALKRLQSIQITRPEQRALVSSFAAALLETERKWPEAESEYNTAILALDAAGSGHTADAGALLTGLGGIYIQERRFDQALETLNAALAICERAPDADPWDRVKILHLRGVLNANKGEWKEAEQDFACALSISDHESRVEPTALSPLLTDYAAVLRRNHRQREARAVETRLAALEVAQADRHIVDVTELLDRRENRP